MQSLAQTRSSQSDIEDSDKKLERKNVTSLKTEKDESKRLDWTLGGTVEGHRSEKHRKTGKDSHVMCAG